MVHRVRLPRDGLFFLLFFMAVSCSEPAAVTAPENGNAEGEARFPSTSAVSIALTCSADVRAAELSCEPFATGGLQGPNTKIIGGQDDYVRLYAPPQTVSYDVGTEIFQAQVFLTNRTWVTLGTPDGVTATGVRVFFHDGPHPASVTVRNPDGTGTFTATGQPYYDFGGTLESFAVANKWWQWDVPSTVSSFTFKVYVQADVEYPSGWIEVTPNPVGIASGSILQMYAKVLEWTGREVVDNVTWSSSANNIAQVDPETGLVTGIAGGVADITAASYGGEPPASARVAVFENARYDIELRYSAEFTATQKQAIEAAVARWETLISGDLAPHLVVLPDGNCPATNEWVDDLLLYVTVVADRPDLQATGTPCRFRNKTGQAGDSLPSAGVIEFDDTDLATVEAAGTLELLAVQQIARALGFASLLWDQYGLRQGKGTSDPVFVGSRAIAKFDSAGGSDYPGTPVPLENSGVGAEDQWRRIVFGCELLAEWCQVTPVSAVTLGSLEDLGYQVNYSAADEFTLTGCDVFPATCYNGPAAGGLTLDAKVSGNPPKRAR